MACCSFRILGNLEAAARHRQATSGGKRGAGLRAAELRQADENHESGVCPADGRLLLDARGAILWKQACAKRREPGAALAATGYRDDAGSESAASLPLWGRFLEPAPTG